MIEPAKAGLSDVSIHSRHFCREIQQMTGCRGSLNMFQSTPGISAGRYMEIAQAQKLNQYVSIHSRHFCREIRPVLPGQSHSGWFQSTPGISAGRYSLSASA